MGYIEEMSRRLISREAGNTIKLGNDGKLYVGTGGVAPFAAEVTPVEGETPPEGEEPPPTGQLYTESQLEAMLKSELEDIVAERAIAVEGTGADGAVLKSDLVAAILADQAGA